MNDLIDLHCHLYGALHPEDLRWLYNRKKPRYEIYKESYFRTWGIKINDQFIDALFDNNQRSAMHLDEEFYLRYVADFDVFQSKFDLIISLSHTDPEELEWVARTVICRQKEGYAEYRMFLPPRYNDAEYAVRLESLARVFTEEGKDCAGLVLSLPRDAVYAQHQYDVIRKFRKEFPQYAKAIKGIDISGKEEGFSPSILKSFMEMVTADNKADPDHALLILYHVGEIYSDKSVESAVRWIYEAALNGAHRLGHTIALGINPDEFLNTVRSEKISERKNQLKFEIENYNKLIEFGFNKDKNILISELKDLETISESSLQKPDETTEFTEIIEVIYDTQRVMNLGAIQNFVISELKRKKIVIEVCPTSNLRIAGLKNPDRHPLGRFMESGLLTVIGSDDPGILDTDLENEFRLISKWNGITPEMIDRLKSNALSTFRL